MPISANFELGETLLLEGDLVTVHGAAHTELVAGDAYRTSKTRRVFDDADDLAVLVKPGESLAASNHGKVM